MNSNIGIRSNRRRFLKTAVSVGIASEFATPTMAKSNAEDLVEYVAYLKGEPPNREKIYETVTHEHWARRFTADDLKDQIYEQIHSTWGENTLLKAQWEPMNDSPTRFGVVVPYTHYHDEEGVRSPKPPIEVVREELPDKGTGTDEHDGHSFRRENIPIRVIETHEYPVDCSGEGSTCQKTGDDHYGQDLPGGVPVYNSTDNIYQSLAAAFYENGDDYGKGWISSGHGFDKSDDAYYPDDVDGDKFGDCKKFNNDFVDDIEWSFIDATDSETPKAYIANGSADGTNEYPVKGIVPDSALKTDTGTSNIYYTNGRSTCRLSGLLIATGGNGTSYVQYTHDIEDGDSGGPLFDVNDGAAYIAAKHTTQYNNSDDEDSDSCKDDAKGTTAETLENKVPGYFMTT